MRNKNFKRNFKSPFFKFFKISDLFLQSCRFKKKHNDLAPFPRQIASTEVHCAHRRPCSMTSTSTTFFLLSFPLKKRPPPTSCPSIQNRLALFTCEQAHCCVTEPGSGTLRIRLRFIDEKSRRRTQQSSQFVCPRKQLVTRPGALKITQKTRIGKRANRSNLKVRSKRAPQRACRS